MFNIIMHALKKTPRPAQPRKAKGKTARDSGYLAEDIAADWLTQQGLKIIARNVRYPFGEIDIVAWHHDVLVLFEVRLRTHAHFGDALASITPRKQARMWAAAQAYAAQFAKPPPMRIDVIAFESITHMPPEWIKNVLG